MTGWRNRSSPPASLKLPRTEKRKSRPHRSILKNRGARRWSAEAQRELAASRLAPIALAATKFRCRKFPPAATGLRPTRSKTSAPQLRFRRDPSMRTSKRRSSPMRKSRRQSGQVTHAFAGFATLHGCVAERQSRRKSTRRFRRGNFQRKPAPLVVRSLPKVAANIRRMAALTTRSSPGPRRPVDNDWDCRAAKADGR
jgi:hypothetical protein